MSQKSAELGMMTGNGMKAAFNRFLVYFSIVVALSFAASALVYQMAFAMWGIDFTAVATSDDILMGGFRMAAIFIPIFVSIATLTAVVSAFGASKGQFMNVGLRRFAAAIVGVTIFLAFVAFVHMSSPTKTPWMTGMGPYRIIIFALLFTAAVSLVLAISVLKIPVSVVLGSVRKNASIVLSSSITISIVALFASLTMTSYLNLSFAEDSFRLPDECSSVTYTATGLGYKIKWIGSKSIVLSCGSTWFVVLNYGEDLFVRVGEPIKLEVSDS